MPDIFIESNPTEERLEQLGVRSWPIWSKEASEFPWTYNEPEWLRQSSQLFVNVLIYASS